MIRSLYNMRWLCLLMVTAIVFPLGAQQMRPTRQQPEDKVAMTLNAMRERYVDTLDVHLMAERIILATVDSLDPHSEYILPYIFGDATGPDAAPSATTAEQELTAGPSILDFSNGIDSVFMADKQVGCVRIGMFTHTTTQAFLQALDSLRHCGMRHLVLDLLGNPGGYFESAVELADQFLSRGQSIVHIAGAHIPSETQVAQQDGAYEEGRLAILISHRTMSAAEIFCGALQDWDRAVLVGQRTFGKGLIQETMPFKDGTQLRYSVAAYKTPCGRSIQRPWRGISKEQYFQGPDASLEHADGSYGTNAPAYRSLLTGRTLYGNGGIAADLPVAPDEALSAAVALLKDNKRYKALLHLK